MRSVRTRFAIVVAALSVFVLGGVALLLLGVAASVAPAERAVLGRILSGQAALLATGGVLLVFGLGFAVWRFFDRYVVPLRRVAAETRLVASVNPAHRLRPAGAAEPFEIALAVNALADRYAAARADVQGTVAAARADLERERDTLAALVSQLALAVLVCDAEGRILLYNPAARRLLGRWEVVGLGRSVYGVVDRGLVGHALERIRAGSATPYETTTAREGVLLRVQVAPVTGGEDEPAGFVLALKEVTRRDEAGRAVSPAALRVHGISSGLLRGRPAVEEVLPALARFAEGSVLVGHDVAFDMEFLRRTEARTGVRLTRPVLDVLLLSAVVHPDHDDHSLEAMAGRLGVGVVGRHTALGDALLTGEVFLRLLPLLASRGVVTLRDARRAARRTSRARLGNSLYARGSPAYQAASRRAGS